MSHIIVSQSLSDRTMIQTFIIDRYIWSSDDDYSDDQLIKIIIRCFGACFEI
jgi:hypothetical protein